MDYYFYVIIDPLANMLWLTGLIILYEFIVSLQEQSLRAGSDLCHFLWYHQISDIIGYWTKIFLDNLNFSSQSYNEFRACNVRNKFSTTNRLRCSRKVVISNCQGSMPFALLEIGLIPKWWNKTATKAFIKVFSSSEAVNSEGWMKRPPQEAIASPLVGFWIPMMPSSPNPGKGPDFNPPHCVWAVHHCYHRKTRPSLTMVP